MPPFLVSTHLPAPLTQRLSTLKSYQPNRTYIPPSCCATNVNSYVPLLCPLPHIFSLAANGHGHDNDDGSEGRYGDPMSSPAPPRLGEALKRITPATTRSPTSPMHCDHELRE
ncbi:hypothetical protein BJV78DRAFT_1260970 [Lactifluus subvellereus]|nr:hypothetical protein BJV78DRAFT_1260970 [Lactifluus subvellereus]